MATITLTTNDPLPALPEPSITGAYVRETREAHGRSLRTTAHAAGISAPYLSDIERGVKDPPVATWLAVGIAAGCDLELLRRKYRLEAARRASLAWEAVSLNGEENMDNVTP